MTKFYTWETDNNDINRHREDQRELTRGRRAWCNVESDGGWYKRKICSNQLKIVIWGSEEMLGLRRDMWELSA